MIHRKWLRWAALLSSVGLLALAAASWVVAGALFASANREVGDPPPGYDAESVSFRSESGSNVAAWYWPYEDAQATVILLHPIRTDRRAMLGRAKLLHEAGYATLAVDLQGHGESPGEHITAGYRERHDVVAACDYIRRRNPEHRIGVVGWSLGGAAALLASPLDIDALVLESVYPTIRQAVHNRIAMRLGPLSYLLTPVILGQFRLRLGLSPSDLRPIDIIDDVACPVLVAAGDEDEHTTLSETNSLFAAAREPKKLVVFTGASHRDLFDYDPHRYGEVIAFLNQHLHNE